MKINMKDVSSEAKDKTNEFTLIFLLDEACEKVLLQRKKRGPYLGMWNGVGGHLKDGEQIVVGARREVLEETASTPDIHFICTISFYTGVTLHCFCGTVNPTDVSQVEDEELRWFDIRAVFGSVLPLAGDGNIPWLLGEAFNFLTNNLI